MFSRFRRFVVAIVMLGGVAWTSTPVQARPFPRHAYRPAYVHPYYFGYAYDPYLYYNNAPYGGGWTNAGSDNTPLPYAYSRFLGGQSGSSVGASDFYIGN